MKLFTLALLFIATTASAQWSNTNNLFYDSLHMPVCTAPKNQSASVIVRSYPDSGYFVIWTDVRDDPNSVKGAPYAQKYDKSGVALWANNGVRLTSSPNNEHYTFQGQNYRSHTYAATDSAGGFYLCYSDDSVTNYIYERLCLQHVKSNGTPVFPGPGYVVASSTTANQQLKGQMIPDGNAGCFVSYMLTNVLLHAYDYKDVNGTMQSLGGGIMNQNAIQLTATSPCGNYTYLSYMDAEVSDYNIFSDLQGGCNVVMNININGSGIYLAYNKLWRAKKTCTATQYVRDVDYTPIPEPAVYTKGNVYRLYYLVTDRQEIACGGGSGGNLYTVTQYRLVQNGFQIIDGSPNVYDIAEPKGVTLSTAGNINTTLMEDCERTYTSGTGVSAPVMIGYGLKEEIYDSIPYQRTSMTSPDYPGYNLAAPPAMNKLNNFRDTLLAGQGGSVFEACLGGGGNQAYTSALIAENDLPKGYRNLRLQHMAVERETADSFAVVYKTNVKQGVIIGEDQVDYTVGAGQYDFPVITVNNNGNAIFYIKEAPGGASSGPVHVSPILTGAQLAWGAMGKTIGMDVWNGSSYNMSSPNVCLDPANGTGLLTWTDFRNNGTTGIDIYMRHLDDLNDPNYQPPYLRVRAIPNPYGPTIVTQPLYGASNSFTTFEANAYLNSTEPGYAPTVDISDNYNLGNVKVSTYENTGGIRNSGGKYYLDRSWTITPDNNPNGAATVSIRLFFTTAQFDALKAADPSISSPGDLGVIKQSSGSGSSYSVVAGEKMLTPTAWAAVPGGYYIEIQVTSFSTFFIFKNTNPLPLTWLGVQAKWENTTQANVSWQVAEQKNIQNYTVQHSVDGNLYTDACTVTADEAKTSYSCIVPGDEGKNYYRVVETDLDGKKNYSTIVSLQRAQQGLTTYPNPVKDILYVDGLANYKIIQITDVNGRIVRQQNVVSSKQAVYISNLASGIYILTVTGASESKTFKFIKN